MPAHDPVYLLFPSEISFIFYVLTLLFHLEISLSCTYSGVMEQLDVGIVPYIVLLVVPVLGRMSDQTDSVRFMATQCFATLIRLMPLEVS